MHVLFLCPSYPTLQHPWQATFYRTQAQALARSGHRVGVVAPAPLSVDWIRQGRMGVRRGVVLSMDGQVATIRGHAGAALFGSVEQQSRAWQSLGEILVSRYLAQHGRPDILHGHCALTGGALAVAIGSREKIPSVITEHSGSFLSGNLSPETLELARSAFSSADACLAVSPQLGAALQELFGESLRPWYWIPNPADEFFKPRQQTGRPRPDRFLILTVGDLVKHKGTSDLLEAFALAFQGLPDVQLRVVGQGDQRDSLERLARRLRVEDQVEWLGQLEPMGVAREMQDCQLLAVPSHRESLSVVLIEALACGKPVIATACGGPECIVNRHNGRLVPPGSIRQLSEALTGMRRESATYDPVEIRSDFEARFGTQTFVKSLCGIYDSLSRSRST